MQIFPQKKRFQYERYSHQSLDLGIDPNLKNSLIENRIADIIGNIRVYIQIDEPRKSNDIKLKIDKR